MSKIKLKKDEKILRKLGQLIVALREEQGLLQLDLADQCGLSPQYLSMIERGKISTSFIKIHKIFSELGYKLEFVESETQE